MSGRATLNLGILQADALFFHSGAGGRLGRKLENSPEAIPRQVYFATSALHFRGAAPSQKKYSLSVAVTDSLGGLTGAPLMLHFAGASLLPIADRHVTFAGLDNCIWIGCILPSLSVVEVIVCDDEACLLHPKNMIREIVSRHKEKSHGFLVSNFLLWRLRTP
jgi:hypothetical protein